MVWTRGCSLSVFLHDTIKSERETFTSISNKNIDPIDNTEPDDSVWN